MKQVVILFLVFLSINSHAQKDSLQIGDRYWEDQLYLNISFNTLTNQPNKIDENTFSFGFSGGYIKDIPLIKSSKIAIGIGLGYSFDSFNYRLKIVYPTNLNLDDSIIADNLKLHNIEMPIQFRIRTSTVNTYSFWRIYTGIKLSYNLSNNFNNTNSAIIINTNSLPEYRKFQTGLTLSTGYSTFNFHAYYGLTSIFKNGFSDKNNTNIVRIGLSFYLL